MREGGRSAEKIELKVKSKGNKTTVYRVPQEMPIKVVLQKCCSKMGWCLTQVDFSVEGRMLATSGIVEEVLSDGDVVKARLRK